MKLHLIFTLSALLAGTTCSGNSPAKISADSIPGIVIKWNNCKQSIDGFGIAQAGWAKELFAFKEREQILDELFGKNGLRLNILRGEIFPHYWENKEDKDFNLNDDIDIYLNDSDFNRKSDDLLRRGQLWLTLKAKNKYHINKLIFSTWSAPSWMKSNGNISNGQLKPECYQDFANYLAAFYNAYKSKGIAPYAISPSNEPGYAAPWNSSLWTADEMGKFISSYLGPTFQKEKIPAKIIFGENPLWSVGMPQLKMVSSKDFTDTILQNYPEVKDFNLIAAGHGYSLSPDIMPIKVDKKYLQTPIVPFDMAEKAHIPVWVTEISDITPLDVSIQDGLNWAATFHNYLTKANVNAIIWWGGAMPTSNNESLIILNKNRKDYILSKRFDILGNFSRYISDGSIRIETAQSDNIPLLISAYKKNDECIIVTINSSEKAISTSLHLDGATINGALKQFTTDKNNRWTESKNVQENNQFYNLTIPPLSIVTFVGKVHL